MKITRQKLTTAFAGALAMLALAAPAAEAKPKIDGQLIGGAEAKGSKVEAPVLLSSRSAKQLGLRSPVATVQLKASKPISAPNPTGQGEITIAANTLRAGDEITGRGVRKRNSSKLMPTVKAFTLKVSDRESAYSLDEVTGALVALYQHVGVLGLRVDALELALADLQAQLEALKAQNGSLANQINGLLAQIADLQTALDDLVDFVGGLPTAADLQAVIDDLEALQTALDNLGIGDIDGLQSELDDLQSGLSGLAGQINAVCAIVDTIPGFSCP